MGSLEKENGRELPFERKNQSRSRGGYSLHPASEADGLDLTTVFTGNSNNFLHRMPKREVAATKDTCNVPNSYDCSSPIYTQPRYLPPSKLLDADVSNNVIGCVVKNCRIHHSVVGLRSCISEGTSIEDTLLMGADYYETETDRKFLAEKGSVPIGIGKNSYIKGTIIDKNARIGDDVKLTIINNDNVQEASKETYGYFIKSGIVMIVKDASIPSGTLV
ncbi:glucose-1-phosphate adenylyltransferase small subunit 2, chloroplastic-like [Hibiscus syriacus]|uniref:glucose-1-phosphate adenylyltransferase small subunit 2, chloroplastic-like n=1 Tax=Hibiscus syriacus TaxID=106335 RepID=UPI001924FCC4|nr:glucose-1-phosphate adenylyltransferase small subunit 2, chloroplastic-like [Hibiscus syriacus]